MLRNRVPVVILLTFVLVTLTFGTAFAAQEEMTVMTSVQAVEMGTDFSGCRVDVAGETPLGSQVYLKIAGPVQTVALSRQGKKGPFWLAVESVTVQGMPGLYQVLSSNGFDLPEGVQQVAGIRPDYGRLYEGARVLVRDGERETELQAQDARSYLNGLVRINEKRDLYRLVEKGIRVHNGSYAGSIFLPSDLPRGDLQLTAYAVRDGLVVAQAQKVVVVRSAGLVRLIGDAAQQQAAAYGLISIMVAVAAGLAVAQVFRRFHGMAAKRDGMTTGH